MQINVSKESFTKHNTKTNWSWAIGVLLAQYLPADDKSNTVLGEVINFLSGFGGA